MSNRAGSQRERGKGERERKQENGARRSVCRAADLNTNRDRETRRQMLTMIRSKEREAKDKKRHETNEAEIQGNLRSINDTGTDTCKRGSTKNRSNGDAEKKPQATGREIEPEDRTQPVTKGRKSLHGEPGRW